jgi:hypothetical protein
MQPAIFHTTARRRDCRHGTAILPIGMWQGSRAIWRIGVLRGDGTPDDLSDVDAIELRVTSYGGSRPGETPWITRPVLRPEFVVPPSGGSIAAGTAWHAEWDLTPEETTLPVEDSGTRAYWYEFRALQGTTPTVLAAGQLLLRAGAGNAADGYATREEVTAVTELARQLIPVPLMTPGGEYYSPDGVSIMCLQPALADFQF